MNVHIVHCAIDELILSSNFLTYDEFSLKLTISLCLNKFIYVFNIAYNNIYNFGLKVG
jgi:hypothetical protein